MKKSFSLGELRVLYVLFLLLLAPTNTYPASVLKLCYRDIRVILSRDLDGSPYKVLIRFTLEFTKTYLGTKDTKTITLPKILFDDSLILSFYVFLESIFFKYRAFEVPSLTYLDVVSRLNIYLDNVYIFRRVVKTSIISRKLESVLKAYDKLRSAK
ncbi:hypothetical protein B0H67DRAFT_556137 [Lasiosphaeris hirsuta]|uniref:Uncharacterized protein n=1 Tax=Lasiosphaeris hirsuta TaxID=260670 RepID=A0AA40A1N9_9PEZI|nr:hypothetical protein B0H67DRAFT_556137 [Lasiosphaeris hirsuta]